METIEKKLPTFTGYQKFIIAILALVQFTVILDFMVLSPLGAQLMRILSISPSRFGLVVSAYAISAGLSGFLAAGFADKFDRKKLLLFFYTGFMIGTLLCGLATDFHFLLIARIVTGIFGGVISSVSFAIITDLFPMEKRGRVMGFVQMAFAASQVLGIPIGLYLANLFDWHAPFLMIVGLCAATMGVIWFYMKPVTEHLKIKSERSPFLHFIKTLTRGQYLLGFAATAMLSIGGFMLMPFSSAFLVRNVGITEKQLPLIFMITGVFAIITGPLVGRLSDKLGKYAIFLAGSALAAVMVVIYTHLGVTPMWQVILINAFLFVGVSSRMISSGALSTAIPDPQDRGAFMGINASIQQISGGIAAAVGGMIIVEQPNKPLLHFDTLGFITVLVIVFCGIMMYFINRMVMNKMKNQPVAKKPEVAMQEH